MAASSRIFLLGALCVSTLAWAAEPDASRVASLVIQGTNELRGEENLPPVVRDGRLEAAAASFASYMARTGRYGHEADASTPSARARQQGYEYCIVSENIAYEYDSEGFTTPALARLFLEGWKRSPEHRRNMLDRGVTETAVAVARSERNGYYYAVQMFGRPKSRSLRFQIRNVSRAATRYVIGEQGYWLGPGVTAAHSQCREVTLVYEGAEFAAHDGDRFVVKKEGGRLQLERE